MIYLFNPTICPQLVGHHTFAPMNYSVVDEETAEMVRKSGAPVILETDPQFPHLWLTWPDMGTAKKLV